MNDQQLLDAYQQALTVLTYALPLFVVFGLGIMVLHRRALMKRHRRQRSSEAEYEPR